jgi:hypothetical protein
MPLGRSGGAASQSLGEKGPDRTPWNLSLQWEFRSLPEMRPVLVVITCILRDQPVPTENSIRGENTESTILCEIIVVSTMNFFLVALFALIASSFRTRVTLQAEILALRHQLAVLHANAPRRPRLKRSDRLLWVLLSRWWWDWRRCLQIVQPATVVAWHRRAFAWYWTRKSRRRPGRPDVAAEIRDLIRHMSQANPLWGAPRIHGELLKLGIKVAPSTVAKYLCRPWKPPSQTWRTFLVNHAEQMASIDFFMVSTAAFRVLFVFVMLSHARRREIEKNPQKHFRQVFFICDEYQHFATVGENDPNGDEKFFALSRQPKCIPIIATQSISSLRSTLPGETWRTLLQTFRTKIFLALSDEFSAILPVNSAAKKISGRSITTSPKAGTTPTSASGLGRPSRTRPTSQPLKATTPRVTSASTSRPSQN